MTPMLKYTTTLAKFDKKGEKTGWTYIHVSSAQANQLKPSCKVSFRVKGRLDQFAIERTALIPMGDGSFILPVNGTMRKALGKKQGDELVVFLAADDRKPSLSPDLVACLNDEPGALAFFKTLPLSHQHYFSNWIESAKTPATKTKRIVMAVTALNSKQGFSEMIRSNKGHPG
jgi:hypothetical protein